MFHFYSKRAKAKNPPSFPSLFPLLPPSLILFLVSRTLDLPLDKIQRLLLANNINTARLVDIADTVALFRHHEHLGPKRRADKLSLFRALGQHLRDGRAVLGIEVRVDFVKEVERCRVRGLDRKDEG